MEVPGSDSGKFFFNFFAHIFYPVVAALLEYLDSAILYLVGITLSLSLYCYSDYHKALLR